MESPKVEKIETPSWKSHLCSCAHYRFAAKERIRCRECVSPSPNATALYSSSAPRIEGARD